MPIPRQLRAEYRDIYTRVRRHSTMQSDADFIADAVYMLRVENGRFLNRMRELTVSQVKAITQTLDDASDRVVDELIATVTKTFNQYLDDKENEEWRDGHLH